MKTCSTGSLEFGNLEKSLRYRIGKICGSFVRVVHPSLNSDACRGWCRLFSCCFGLLRGVTRDQRVFYRSHHATIRLGAVLLIQILSPRPRSRPLSTSLWILWTMRKPLPNGCRIKISTSSNYDKKRYATAALSRWSETLTVEWMFLHTAVGRNGRLRDTLQMETKM